MSDMAAASGGTSATTMTAMAAHVSAKTCRAEWASSLAASARPHTSMQHP